MMLPIHLMTLDSCTKQGSRDKHSRAKPGNGQPSLRR